MDCTYCRTDCGRDTIDHLIPKRFLDRVGEDVRENPRYKVPAGLGCNVRKYTRCFVPPGYEHLIPELQELTGARYGVFDGSAESLRVLLV